MKLPHLLEFISFLVMGNVSRAGIDPSGRNSTETVPNLDIDAVNGHISILDNSTSMLDNSSHTFSHMDNGTLDEDNIDVKCMLASFSLHYLCWSQWELSICDRKPCVVDCCFRTTIPQSLQKIIQLLYIRPAMVER